MLEAGKHVVCEKPLAATWEECKKVLDFAREKKLLFIEVIAEYIWQYLWI